MGIGEEHKIAQDLTIRCRYPYVFFAGSHNVREIYCLIQHGLAVLVNMSQRIRPA